MWKQGPMPPDTYFWGGVVPVGMTTGFLFADFKGDHVDLMDGTTLKADEVAWYNNCLELPPSSTGVKGRTG